MARNVKNGFTLVELLVGMAILSLLIVLLLGITNETARITLRAGAKVEQFRAARTAFETITRRLSQATLNTYWDYDNATTPTRYLRQSELRFLSGPAVAGDASSTPSRPTHSVFFQAPIGYVSDTLKFGGLETLLNTWGYYVEFDSDSATRPDFITPSISPLRYRFRLMEFMEPSDQMSLYQYTSGRDSSGVLKCSLYNTREWFATQLAIRSTSHVLAENIIALVILPKLSTQEDSTGTTLSPEFGYDSSKTDKSNSATVNAETNWKNQLPPVLQVTMVAVDEASFKRLQTGTAAPALGLASLFKTAGSLTDSNQNGYAKDLKTLETTLQSNKLNYRIFTSNVIVKGAKWSRAQTK